MLRVAHRLNTKPKPYGRHGILTGVFIETDARVFTIGETIQLSVQIDGMIKPFEATASVVRFSLKLGQKSGYGLKFQDLDPEIVAEIEWFVGVFTNQIRNVA